MILTECKIPLLSNNNIYLTKSKQREATVEQISDDIAIEWNVLSPFDCLRSPQHLIINNSMCYQVTTDSIRSTTPRTRSPDVNYECKDANYIGSYCNATIDPCIMLQPCDSSGICYANDTLPSKYICLCPPGYSGHNCRHDHRICKENTCWHNGHCIELDVSVSIDNMTKFLCECTDGYNGIHCELKTDMCFNITCENQGVCRSSHLSWFCQCLDPTLYYGDYCEHKKASLVARQILGKSFASIAIIAIAAVFVFVMLMDILKYVFSIDPVDRERQSMKLKRMKNKLNRKISKRGKHKKQFYEQAFSRIRKRIQSKIFPSASTFDVL